LAEESEVERQKMDAEATALGFAYRPGVSQYPVRVELHSDMEGGSNHHHGEGESDESTFEGEARSEWFTVEYDRVFDPRTAYHLELRWLVATGTRIEEWIHKLVRKAKALQFQVVRIPAAQPLRTGDSFHLSLPIPLPSITPLRLKAQYHLVRDCGFVLDFVPVKDARRQFIHSSGMALVREVSSGFVWVDNHLMDIKEQRDACIKMFQHFSKYCAELSLSVAASASHPLSPSSSPSP